jgi:SAM-dependent methyltransferase
MRWRLKNKDNLILKDYKKIQGTVSRNTHNSHYKIYKKYEFTHSNELIKWIYIDNIGHKIKALDIGSGYGTMSTFLKMVVKADVYAMDFVDLYYPKELFQKLDIKFSVSNIETQAIPFFLGGRGEFDVIVLAEVLEHFNFYPTLTLRKIKDALAKDGTLYLSTPNAKYWGRVDLYKKLGDIPFVNPDTPIRDQHIWQYDTAELLYVLDEAGLAVVDFDFSWSEPGNISRHHFNVKCKRKEEVLKLFGK